jgi:hypothetical protein
LHPLLPARAIAVALLAVVVAPAAQAATCADGKNVSVKGRFYNEKAATSAPGRAARARQAKARKGARDDIELLEVAESRPCEIDFVEIAKSAIPWACVPGARFTASGKAEDQMFIILIARTLSCP